MHSTNIRQTFALNNDEIITSIREVQRGLNCNCTCPSCGASLIAKQGKVRDWHFAHAAKYNCVNGAESSLHLAAKQFVAQESQILIPDENDGLTALIIESADLEMSWSTDYGKVIPDVTITSEAEIYFIEIVVTSSIDEPKREKINSLNVPTLIIYLDPSMMAEWSWHGLKEHVIDGQLNKQWLPKHPIKTINNASEISIKHEEKFDRQTSFLIDSVQVTVRRYEWFTTIKSMYNQHVNKLLISMSHKFNGYWNSIYKTCNYPRSAFKAVCDHLKQLGAKQIF